MGVGRLVSITNWWFSRSMFIYQRVLLKKLRCHLFCFLVGKMSMLFCSNFSSQQDEARVPSALWKLSRFSLIMFHIIEKWNISQNSIRYHIYHALPYPTIPKPIRAPGMHRVLQPQRHRPTPPATSRVTFGWAGRANGWHNGGTFAETVAGWMVDNGCWMVVGFGMFWGYIYI